MTNLVNAKLVLEYLREKGLSEEGVAGVMGNIHVETGGTFDYRQKQLGGGNGYGLFQFDFMKKYYMSWLKETSNNDSYQSQIDFMMETIDGNKKDLIGSGNAKKVLTALQGSSVDVAAEVFCNLWEKPGVPHLQKRKEHARSYYNCEIV
eukprot:TRINITY_DN10698_c0_g1_i1.p1 TRINITY_DN10698_c0_g1~~TRINITY_DN10698_c0_g1_i1.p1  ORF type:complete len:149 (+),score=39.73 TRINITY_DN10698_c0_g1_i1:78-524(+)